MGNMELRLVRFFFETALFIGLFHGVTAIRKPKFIYKLIAFSLLSFLLALYILDFLFPNIFLRFFLRFLVFAFYLKLIKGISWQKTAYFSGISCSSYYALQNIFITPLLYPFFTKSFVIVYLVFVLLFVFLYFNISFDNIAHIGSDRTILLIAVISCILYVKYSLSIMIDGIFLKNIEMTLFPILLQLFLIASIYLLEKYLYARMHEEEARIQEVITDYKLRSTRNRLSAEEDLRILTHDMKNHFIAIKNFAKTSNIGKLNGYIDNLLLTLESNDKYVETGNELLDGFLSEKIAEAEKYKIEVTIILDFRPFSFISDMDLCSIFGNALDNAIEAAKKVPNEAERYISVYSSSTAGQMAISFSNSYIGKINKANGLPISTKKLPRLHGFGLTSISKTLQKYDGIVSINTDTDHKFILTAMFPLPE